MSELDRGDDVVTLYETQSGFILHVKWLLVGGAAAFYALLLTPDAAAGRLSKQRQGYLVVAGLAAVVGLGGAAVRNRQRVKWIRTGNRNGVEWTVGGDVWHRRWDQLVRVHTHTQMKFVVGRDDRAQVTGRTLTVSFDDGAEFEVASRELLEYAKFAAYLQGKVEQTEAARAAAENVAELAAVRQEAADRVTRFGPLGVYNHGVEWDGIYTLWEQVEKYEVTLGVLLIRTTAGDEFVRRTADLGDWRTAVARLDAAAGRMAAR